VAYCRTLELQNIELQDKGGFVVGCSLKGTAKGKKTKPT
jgi:hypothetical protein